MMKTFVYSRFSVSGKLTDALQVTEGYGQEKRKSPECLLCLVQQTHTNGIVIVLQEMIPLELTVACKWTRLLAGIC